MYRLPLAALVALLPGPLYAQRNATIPDPDPELERKTFVVAPGFEVNLFAADPLLAKPIQMNFDPQGRLWVASSETYPQIKPGEVANDKIVILEDKDGDGKADSTTVFADGLLIPTGVEPGDGGAYVANSTEIVHLSASKPGGKADRSRVVLSGFGTEDTHHIVHTFRWGPDGCLYFNQSVYIHSHIETPHGVKRLNAGGIWRYRPETSQLDVFVRGFWNTWGHHFDRWGQSLITDGANGEGITHGVPGAYYPAAQGPHVSRILHGLNPGSPKHCGLEVLSGRHLPDDWQGDVITNDFRGHRVCRFKLQDDASTFASREMPELIKSSHPAFRPIDVKMGPDGAIYIADWYNPIIQHGEVDFRDPRRDKVHGRIWRITAKGRPLVPKPKLVDATVPELLERLKDPEQWTRERAKRVLKERGKDAVLPELQKWVAALDRTAPNYDAVAVEAMWVYQSFGTPDRELTERLLTARDPHARAAAVRAVATELGQFHQSGLSILTTATADDSPRVRLEAVRGLAQERTPAAVEAALGALNKPMDRVLDYALWLTVRELEPVWLPAFREGKLTFGGDAKKLAFALGAVGSRDTVGRLVALANRDGLPADQRAQLWLLVARIGGPDELGRAIGQGLDDPAHAEALLAAVEASVRERKVAPPPKPFWPKLATLAASDRAAVRTAAARLIGAWKLEPYREQLEAAAVAADRSPDERRSAMLAVAELGGPKAGEFLKAIVAGKHSPADRRAAVVALAGLSVPDAAAAAAGLLTTADPTDDPSDLFAAFLARKGGAAALAKALADKKLNPDVAKLGVRAVRASLATDAAPLSDALAKSGGLGAARKEPTADEVKAFVGEALDKGDATRGEAIFRRKDLQCLACHGVGGAGGQVGPDLTSIGASAQPDYLVESLLIPNKAVKEGFHSMRVVTADDKVFLGIKVRETKDQLVLRTPEDKEVVIPAADVAEKGTARSLMPDALTDTLTRAEFADLTRFLSELGKVGPYAPNPARVVRRWQLIEPTGDNLALFRRGRVAAAAEAGNPFAWSPLYARVSGSLPLAELPKFSVWKDTDPLTVVRCHLDVTTGGPVALKLNSAAGLTLYVGAAPVEAKEAVTLDLKPGVVPLTFVVDRTKRADDLRVELADAPGSPARAAVVAGK